MVTVRMTNDRCIFCAPTKPQKVVDKGVADYRKLKCPKCDSLIVEGVVSTDGEVASTPTNPPRGATDDRFSISPHVSWKTWEVWWTGMDYTVAIHGVYVGGSKELYELVEDIRVNDV